MRGDDLEHLVDRVEGTFDAAGLDIFAAHHRHILTANPPALRMGVLLVTAITPAMS